MGEIDPHAEHGRGTAEDGPDDPDCVCRDTADEAACAARGCGFCIAAQGRRDGGRISAQERAFVAHANTCPLGCGVAYERGRCAAGDRLAAAMDTERGGGAYPRGKCSYDGCDLCWMGPAAPDGWTKVVRSVPGDAPQVVDLCPAHPLGGDRVGFSISSRGIQVSEDELDRAYLLGLSEGWKAAGRLVRSHATEAFSRGDDKWAQGLRALSDTLRMVGDQKRPQEDE